MRNVLLWCGLGMGLLAGPAQGAVWGGDVGLHTGVSMGMAPQAMAAGGHPNFGGTVKLLGGMVEPEFNFGYGGYGGPGFSKLRLSVGSRFGVQLGPVRPFLWTAYSHIHETLIADIVKDPVGTTLTTSNRVGHRSGLELGVGAATTIPLRLPGGVRNIEIVTRLSGIGVPQMRRFFPDSDPIPVSHDGYVVFDVLLRVPLLDWGKAEG